MAVEIREVVLVARVAPATPVVRDAEMSRALRREIVEECREEMRRLLDRRSGR
jgi:hypothetical protein